MGTDAHTLLELARTCWVAQGTLSALSRVATREESGVLGFPSRRGLTPRGSLVVPVQEMQQMRVQFLGGGDHLEKGMATHSCILAWRISWTEEPCGYSP